MWADFEANTFNANKYDSNAIQHVADADLSAIPVGTTLPSVQTASSGLVTVHN